MSKMTQPMWNRDVGRRIGLRGPLNFTTTRVGQTLHLPCKTGHIVDFLIQPNTAPDFVVKKLLNAGWTVGGKLLCPDCQPKRKPKKLPMEADQFTKKYDDEILSQIIDMKKQGLTYAQIDARLDMTSKAVSNLYERRIKKRLDQMIDLGEIRVETKEQAESMAQAVREFDPSIKVTVEPRIELEPMRKFVMSNMQRPEGSAGGAMAAVDVATQRKLKRDILSWLEECYDEKNARYKDGFSDETVAKETGAAPKFVAQLREEFYGPMGEPEELARLRTEFAEFNRKHDAHMTEYQKGMGAFQARLERIAVKNGWNLI